MDGYGPLTVRRQDSRGSMQTKSGLTQAIQNELAQVAAGNSPAENAELVRELAAKLCDRMTKPEMQRWLYELLKREGTP